MVSKKLLVNVSNKFAAALSAEHHSKDSGILRFPDDNLAAWQVMMYWIYDGQVPEMEIYNDCEDVHLVRCWCLGDKYYMPQFQDLVMLELLHYIECGGQITLESVREAFENTTSGSLLRRLMAECTVELLKAKSLIEPKNLEYLDGLTGFSTALVEALEEWAKYGAQVFNRLPVADGPWDEVTCHWQTFMLYGPPEQHWVHDPGFRRG